MEGGIWGFESLSLYGAAHWRSILGTAGSNPVGSTPPFKRIKDVVITDDLKYIESLIIKWQEAAKRSSFNTVTGPGFGPKQKEVKVSARNVAVSPAGLTEVVSDLVALLPTTRTIEKMAEQTGRYYTTQEKIPAEELFTIVAIRVGADGKFVVQLSENDLDRMNKNKVRDTAVSEYESK